MHRAPGALALALAAIGGGTSASAHSDGPPVQIIPLVQTADAVAGVGAVTSIEDLGVLDSGEWFALVDTDNPSQAVDGALLKNGALWEREGDSLPYPMGTTVATFEDVELAPTGDLVWTCLLGGTSGPDEDAALYWEHKLILREGGSIIAPELPAATLRKVLMVRVNAQRQILALVQVDDPSIPTDFDHVLLRIDVNAGGMVLGAQVLFKEGDVLAGSSESIADFAYSAHALGWNDAELPLYFADLTGDVSSDGLIALSGITLAKEGSLAPVPGHVWSSLAVPKIALSGSHSLYTGLMDGHPGSNELLVVDGAAFAREGDTLPPIAPYTLKGFGSGPAHVSDAGAPIWFGDWDEPAFPGTSALFRGQQVLVRENVTLIGSATVAVLAGNDHGFAASRSGLYVAFEATLSSGVEGAYLARPAASAEPMAGCLGNPGQLWVSGGPPSLGASISFSMGSSPMSLAAGRLFFSAGTLADLSGCGAFLPGIGEILIAVQPPAILASLGAFWSGSTLTFPIAIAPDPSLAGVPVYAQGAFIDALGLYPTAPIALTNALECWLGF